MTHQAFTTLIDAGEQQHNPPPSLRGNLSQPDAAHQLENLRDLCKLLGYGQTRSGQRAEGGVDEYLKDVSAQDDRQMLVGLGFPDLADAFRTLAARRILGELNRDGLLPGCVENDKYGFQGGVPNVEIGHLTKRFNISYDSYVDKDMRRFGIEKCRTKWLVMAEVLEVLESKHNIEDLEALRVHHRKERITRPLTTLHGNPMRVWEGHKAPPPEWGRGGLDEIYGDGFVGRIHCLQQGTLLPEEEVCVFYAEDRSLISLVEEIGEWTNESFDLVSKLWQWRLDKLVISKWQNSLP